MTSDNYYNNKQWRKLRAWQLRREPLCVLCARMGRTTQADTVDHVIAHKGNIELFYDSNNLQSLCASCHSTIKQMQERNGYSSMCDTQGNPIDSKHPWNKNKSEMKTEGRG